MGQPMMAHPAPLESRLFFADFTNTLTRISDLWLARVESLEEKVPSWMATLDVILADATTPPYWSPDSGRLIAAVFVVALILGVFLSSLAWTTCLILCPPRRARRCDEEAPPPPPPPRDYPPPPGATRAPVFWPKPPAVQPPPGPVDR